MAELIAFIDDEGAVHQKNSAPGQRLGPAVPTDGYDLSAGQMLPFRGDNRYSVGPVEVLLGKRRCAGLDMMCRGVRGATTAEANTREDILEATRELLALLIRRNGMEVDEIASIIFTTTQDLNAEFPALAARQIGLIDVPLLCGHEMAVEGSLPRCIRILVHWNTDRRQDEMQHIYVRGAEALRPDVQQVPKIDRDELDRWIASKTGHGPGQPK